jgi:hypothetical protein
LDIFVDTVNSPNLKRPTKCVLRNIHTRPTVTYGSECLPVSKKDGSMFRNFERRILRMIYGPVNDNGIWRTGHGNEPYSFCDELDVV